MLCTSRTGSVRIEVLHYVSERQVKPVVLTLDIWEGKIKISSDVTLCFLGSPPSALLVIYLHNALPFSLGTTVQVSVEVTVLVRSEGALFEY